MLQTRLSSKQKSLRLQLVLTLLVLIIAGASPLQAQDPGSPDSVYPLVRYAGIDAGQGGNIRIEFWLQTDNTGPSNDIVAIGLPVIITSSNPAALPVLDTTIAHTFFSSDQSYNPVSEVFNNFLINVTSNDGDPSIFPITSSMALIKTSQGNGLFDGEYLIGTFSINLQDTTTLCVDTITAFPLSPQLSTSGLAEYFGQWNPFCVLVDEYEQGQPPIFLSGHSPINIIVVDPAGDSIGYDFNTMDSAYYVQATDSIAIFSTLPGEYKIKVVRDPLDPSPDTTYSINIRIDGTADQALVSAATVPAAQQVQSFEVTNQPTMVECLSVPGDATADGVLGLSDVIATINHVFIKTGCLPLPECWMKGFACRGDWNGDSKINLSDVIRAANFAFNKPNGPWNPLVATPCCLPLPTAQH